MKTIKTITCLLLLTAFATSCSKDNDSAEHDMLDEFTIGGTASSAYFTTPNNATPAPENDQAKAFISLSDRRVYSWAQALTDQSKMDIVLGTSYYQQPNTPNAQPNGSVGLKLSSLADGSAWEANTNGRDIKDFTHRSSFKMARITKSYSDINTVHDLDEVFATVKDDDWQEQNALIDRYGTEVSTNILVFKTQDAKRGVMRLNNYNPYKPFIYEIAFKMEQ